MGKANSEKNNIKSFPHKTQQKKSLRYGHVTCSIFHVNQKQSVIHRQNPETVYKQQIYTNIICVCV